MKWSLVLFFIVLCFASYASGVGCECSGEFKGNRISIGSAAGHQSLPRMDADPVTGRFFVIWTSHDRTPDQWTVRGRMYSASGEAFGSEILFDVVPLSAGSVGAFTVVFNTRNREYFVAWTSWNSSSRTQEIRSQIIRENGTTASSSFHVIIRRESTPITPGRIVYNRIKNEYVFLFEIENFSEPPNQRLFVQRYRANRIPIASPIRVNSSSRGSVEYSDIRFDFMRNRYLVAWQISDPHPTDSTKIMTQSFDSAFQKAGPNRVVADLTGFFGTPRLLFSGSHRAFVLFWHKEQNKQIARLILPDGSPSPQEAELPLPYITAVRQNPETGGFILLYGRTPKIARLDRNFQIVERGIVVSCQAGDRNFPEWLGYNPVSKEFLVFWSYNFWISEGGREIFLRRLRSIPDLSVSCEN